MTIGLEMGTIVEWNGSNTAQEQETFVCMHAPQLFLNDENRRYSSPPSCAAKPSMVYDTFTFFLFFLIRSTVSPCAW